MSEVRAFIINAEQLPAPITLGQVLTVTVVGVVHWTKDGQQVIRHLSLEMS